MTHVSKDVLNAQLEAGYRLVPKESVWVHYKDPLSCYIVDKLVIIEANDKVGVAYQIDEDPELIMTRPLNEWLEEVEVDGIPLPRYMLVSEQEQS